MRSQLTRSLLGLLLAAGIIVAAIGVTPNSAKAVTTSYLNGKVTWLVSQVKSIKSVNSSQAEAISWLKRQVAALRSADDLNTTADAAQGADIAALQKQVTALGSRLASAETSVTSLESRVADLEAALAAHTGATSSY